jgi:putative oxidoreductase
MNRLNAWSPQVLSVLRIITGLLFGEHGTMKLLHWPVPQPGASAHLPPLLLTAGVLEMVGGALIVLGLFTRPTAFILCGQMAVAYWIAHAPRGTYPAVNMGDAAILYCFVFLYLVFAGPGPISLDAMMRRRGR